MLPVPGGAGYTPVANQGRRLAQGASEGQAPELVQLVSYLIDVLAGLSVLHDDVEGGRRFVHGEVSPEHILIGDDGVARLVPILSRHVLLVGPSPNGYGAPELLLGEAPDFRADLFSVGVMLWEALAGARLFTDPSGTAVLARLEREKLRPPPVPSAHPWAAPLERDVVRSFRRGPVGKAGVFAAVAAAAIGLLAAVHSPTGVTRAAAGGVARGTALSAEPPSPAQIALPPAAKAPSAPANSARAEIASPPSSAARSPRSARPGKASRPRAAGHEDYGI